MRKNTIRTCCTSTLFKKFARYMRQIGSYNTLLLLCPLDMISVYIHFLSSKGGGGGGISLEEDFT